MKETKRKARQAKGAQRAQLRPRRKATAAAGVATNCKLQQLPDSSKDQAPPDDVVLMASEPAINLRAVMNAHGAGLLAHLGQQMNAHLNSLAVLEGASRTLTFQCNHMAMEIRKLLEALEHYQGAQANALAQATLLRRLVAEFAQHVYNSHALGLTNP